MNRTAAVVVTYNRKELLLENMYCLMNQQDAECDIMIIDNASTDGTEEALAELRKDPRVNYINTGANLGGAGGFSFGIKKAVEAGYEFVWIMDDDCMPAKHCLARLLKADEELEGNYGFLSSRVMWKDRKPCIMNLQREKLTKPVEKFDVRFVPVVIASFVSFFVKADVVKDVGLPIKEFFIWTDDWEYSRRISRKYPCYAISDSVVMHKSPQNVGANIHEDDMERMPRYRMRYRNEVVLYRREGLKGWGYECIRLGGHVVRIIMKAPDHKLTRIKQVVLGTKDGLFFHPPVEYVEAGADESSGDSMNSKEEEAAEA